MFAQLERRGQIRFCCLLTASPSSHHVPWRGFCDVCHLAVTLSQGGGGGGGTHSERALNLPRQLLRMISFVIKVKFTDLSGSVCLSGGKKNGGTGETNADSSLSNQFEGNTFNHFMKHQHPRAAPAILYPMHIISDLGHMAVPPPIAPSSWAKEAERRRRWRFVAVLKGGGDTRGVTGLGSCGLAWKILCNPPTSPMALFTVCR